MHTKVIDLFTINKTNLIVQYVTFKTPCIKSKSAKEYSTLPKTNDDINSNSILTLIVTKIQRINRNL